MLTGGLRERIEVTLGEFLSAVETELELTLVTVEMVVASACPENQTVAVGTELYPPALRDLVILIEKRGLPNYIKQRREFLILLATKGTEEIEMQQTVFALIAQGETAAGSLCAQLELSTDLTQTIHLDLWGSELAFLYLQFKMRGLLTVGDSKWVEHVPAGRPVVP